MDSSSRTLQPSLQKKQCFVEIQHSYQKWSPFTAQGRQCSTLFISVHFCVSLSCVKILDPVKSLQLLSLISILPCIKYLLITKESLLVQGQSVLKVPSKAKIIPQGTENHHKSHYLLVQGILSLLSVT